MDRALNSMLNYITKDKIYDIFKEKNIVPEVLICNENVEKELNKASIIRVF